MYSLLLFFMVEKNNRVAQAKNTYFFTVKIIEQKNTPSARFLFVVGYVGLEPTTKAL